MFKLIPSFLFTVLFANLSYAQIDEDQTGAWYMYLWNTTFQDSQFGLQGDIQHRNWDMGGDLEQLLIRGGVTWSPQSSNIKYTFGYAHITSGAFGSSSNKTEESRIYQEALIPQQWGDKLFISHRLRLEQRWVDDQDFRNRFRYFIGANYPLNGSDLNQGSIYLSFYNELFLNLEKDIGNNRQVDDFDRNRTYLALGYSLSDRARVQFGYMHQETKNNGKGQIQFNLFHTF